MIASYLDILEKNIVSRIIHFQRELYLKQSILFSVFQVIIINSNILNYIWRQKFFEKIDFIKNKK